MDNWLFKKGKRKEQAALYKLFVTNKGLTTDQLKECLLAYQDKFINGLKIHSTVDRFTLDCVTFEENFSKFLQIVTEKTGVVFKRRPRKKRKYRNSYDDWWQQSNMDGSFAYNGVTDDF